MNFLTAIIVLIGFFILNMLWVALMYGIFCLIFGTPFTFTIVCALTFIKIFIFNR